MNTLQFILKKYRLNSRAKSPLEISNIGRAALGNLFKELNFKTGAEIGTARGLFAEALCQAHPDLELFCIDPWKNYPGYRDFQGTMDKNYQEAKIRLSPYSCRLIRQLSLTAVNKFKNESLDFVYLDGNHNFPHVVNDLWQWSKKVRPGGIIAGHDYVREKRHWDTWPHTSIQVVEAVVGFTQAYDIRPWFLLGRKWPEPGETRDSHRSFMWVRGQYV